MVGAKPYFETSDWNWVQIVVSDQGTKGVEAFSERLKNEMLWIWVVSKDYNDKLIGCVGLHYEKRFKLYTCKMGRQCKDCNMMWEFVEIWLFSLYDNYVMAKEFRNSC